MKIRVTFISSMVETSCYLAFERLVNEYLDEIKLETLYAGYIILLILRNFKALINLVFVIILLSSVK